MSAAPSHLATPEHAFAIAQAQEKLGHYALALVTLQQNLRLYGEHLPSLCLAADIYLRLGQPTRAMVLLRQSLRQSNEDALQARFIFARWQAGGLENFNAIVERLCTGDAPSLDLARILARVFLTFERRLEAQEIYRSICQNPQAKTADQFQLATLLELDGRLDEALELALKLHERHPNLSEPYGLLIGVLEKKGEFDAAQKYLQSAQEKFPDDPQILNQAGLIAKSPKAQKRALEQIVARLQKNKPPMNNDEIRRLEFRRGHLCDSLGLYEEAMQGFRRGNALKDVVYAQDTMRRSLESLKTYFNDDYFKLQSHRINTTKTEGPQPLFIVGMPRSGTSLTEKMLSRHPQIVAAGELPHISDIIRRFGQESIPYPNCMPHLRDVDIENIRQFYLERLYEHLPTSGSDGQAEIKFITDKTPLNALHLGLIRTLFADAKIIHTRRNPIDTCLSCYFQDFSEGNSFAFDLENSGRFYRLYAEIMKHWRRVLPEKPLDSHYEHLVLKPKQSLQEWLAYLELPFDSACLEFDQDAKDYTNTASFQQVRKPLYRSSTKRFKNYEPFVAPLLEQLSGLTFDGG